MNFLNKYFKFTNGTELSGLTSELIVLYLNELYQQKHQNIIVVTNSLYESNKLFNYLKTYEKDVYLFPMDDFLSSVIVAESPELKYKRLETLDKLRNNQTGIILTNLMGYLKYLPSINVDNSIIINKNDIFKREEIEKKINKIGYHRDSLVTKTGEYAIRGCIIDIFPIDEIHPIRIELDGNKIEEISYFDEDTQITTKEINKIQIKAIDEINTSSKNSLLDYAKNAVVVYIDITQIKASYKKLINDIFEYKQSKNIKDKMMFQLDELKPNYNIILNTFNSSKNDIQAKSLINYNSNFDKLKNDFIKYIKQKKEIIFCLSTEKQAKIIKNLLPTATIIKKKINHGFILGNYIIIGENDIEETHHKDINYKSNYHVGKKIQDYNQLNIGDYVVHINHGIGIYKGIKTLKINGVEKDFIEISYEGTDKIYVPVEKISSIYKYTDKNGTPPKINKLGSINWEKTKKYVSGKIKDISQDLIKLYKERINIKSKPYKDFDEETEFANSFPYKVTPDQKKAIIEINNDLKSKIPMDRLLCGDVGFGKTEVALRAMFKTVLNDEQVMYLCPTTILSKQQYLVAKERYQDWPIEIALLNRNISNKKVNQILTDFSNGKIDILIGTHRILSDDVKPKNLGLLVVDEEQRFGVVHKEKIKKLKSNINVLTLSATPIPRTLKMSLSGLRDLSIIDTPPIDRYPVQTYVVIENDLIIRDAIYKELSREGQVFILYNKVETIEKFTNKIKELVPDANIKFAHGQMNKNELDEIMTDFVEHKFDVLICTTIIESGIDIPNVNTLLVYDADKFGLSQLYQIRGRVGRSNRIAYAYLLYKENKVLNETAIKRLQSIKEFTELGSGYRIAMRDLSLRGAGDIFGSNQAGFVDQVGIQLYMKLIDDELKRQQGIEIPGEDTSVNALLNVSTHISDDYVSDEDIKIEIHQKINEIDSYEKLLLIKDELENRFGKISNDMLIYMYEEWFEKLAKKYNITKVIQTDRIVEIEFPQELSKNIKGDKLLIEALSLTRNFNIKYVHNQIVLTLYYKNLEKHFIFYLVPLLAKVL